MVHMLEKSQTPGVNSWHIPVGPFPVHGLPTVWAWRMIRQTSPSDAWPIRPNDWLVVLSFKHF